MTLPARPRCPTCSNRDLTTVHQFCARCRYAQRQLSRAGVTAVSKEGHILELGLSKTVTYPYNR